MRITEIIEATDQKTPASRNFVAKHARINRAATHKDRKKARDRGEPRKHKARRFDGD